MMKRTKVTIKKKINAVNTQLILNKLRKKFGKIYSDELLLQRLLDVWDDVIATNHIIAFLEGHSNIYSIVLIDILSALADARGRLKDFTKEDPQYNNIKETVDYLEGIKNKGFEYLCVDGQHRLNCYNRYLKSEFALTESFIVKLETADGMKVSYDLKDKLFKDIEKPIQDEILNGYKVLVTSIQKGTLEDLVNVTIYTNLGEPWNRHEMRIILPSSFNMWIHKLQAMDALLNKVFSIHISDMGGKDYKLTKKGDSLMIAEWVGYLHNSKKDKIYVWPNSDTLDTMSSIEGLTTLSNKILKDSKSVIQKLAEIVNSTGAVVKTKRSTMDNLLILLSVFENSNHPMNTFDGIIKVTDLKSFYDWFLKADLKLRKKDKYVIDPNTNKIMVNPTTNTKLKNSESYNSKCGAKKVDDIKLRMSELMKEFSNDYSKLFGDGVIELYDDSSITKDDREQVAVDSNFTSLDGEELTYFDVFGEGNSIDVDDKLARARGGKADVENYGLRKASKNRSKGKKIESFAD